MENSLETQIESSEIENKFDDSNTEFDERMLESWAYSLPKHRLTEISKLINRISHTRFSKSRNTPPKYGALNLAWSRDKVQQFLRVVDNRMHKTMFLCLLCMGLREAETVNLKVEDIISLPTTFYDEAKLKEKWSKNLPWMRVQTLKQKGGTYDFVPIPQFLYEELQYYIEVEKPSPYLFPGRRKEKASFAIIRDRFRFYCHKAGLETVYGYSEDENNPRRRKDGQARRLFIEKAHGFGRHTYRAVLESTDLRDWEVAVLGRWHQIGANPAYNFKNPGKWWELVNNAFDEFVSIT